MIGILLIASVPAGASPRGFDCEMWRFSDVIFIFSVACYSSAEQEKFIPLRFFVLLTKMKKGFSEK